jgi:hypothetical protein
VRQRRFDGSGIDRVNFDDVHIATEADPTYRRYAGRLGEGRIAMSAKVQMLEIDGNPLIIPVVGQTPEEASWAALGVADTTRKAARDVNAKVATQTFRHAADDTLRTVVAWRIQEEGDED